MHSLPLFLRVAGRPVILIGEGAAAAAKARLIERAGGIIRREEEDAAAGACLAFVAIEDSGAARAAAERLRARGCLVNVVDQPALCDFTTPAIVDRDPVLVAVGTGGASAGLAKAVRQRIERLLPATLGPLATALADAREALRARLPTPAARRAALDAALAGGGPLDPLLASAAAVAPWLTSADTPPPARMETIRLHSADPDELTLRAARLLGEADLVLHDPGVPAAILARARADSERRPFAADEMPAGSGLTVRLITAM